jgi:WD40 repeat protein
MRKPFTIVLFFILQMEYCYAQQLIPIDNASLKNKNTLLWAADWNPHNEQIAVGGDDSLLLLYNSRTAELVKAFGINSMIRQLSWHPHKNIIAIAANDKAGILNIETGFYTELKNTPEGARGIGWNFNGQLLATADNEGLVKIWNIEGHLLRTIRKDDSNSYFSLHWHPHKNILAVSGDDIRIIDTSGNTKKVIKHRRENTGVLTIRWHPSGKFFVTGDYGHDKEGVESLIQFWKEDGSFRRTLHGSKAEYRNTRWDKTGTYLASASDALRIWDKNGRLLFTGKSTRPLWGLSWNEGNDSIVATSSSGMIKLWSKRSEGHFVARELNK